MNDQTDLLAQLTRLHAQGLLTDAEYEAKKDTLRIGVAPRSESTQGADKDDRHNRPSIRERSAYAALLAVVVLGFLGFLISQAGKPVGGKPSSPASVDGIPQVTESPVSSSGDGWTATTERDPMTDVSYGQAVIKLSGQEADATIQVTCSSTGALAYIITTFDKSGDTTPMRVNTVGARIVNDSVSGSSQVNPLRWQQGYGFINYEIRAGAAPAVRDAQYNPRYNNQIEIEGLPNRDHLLSLAAADTATFRVQMPYGDETYRWSQTVEPFKSVASPCLLAQQKAQADEKARTGIDAQRSRTVPYPD